MRDKSLRSGERQYAQSLAGIEQWHRWRYEETLQYIDRKTVLDVGCGVGYGSYIMAGRAIFVTGVDDSEEAINHAKKYFQNQNTLYIHSDFMKTYNRERFDVIVAYEFIEHIKDIKSVFYKFKKMLPELIIISTPHKTTPLGANKFHYRHSGMDEILQYFRWIGYKPKRAELRYFDTSLNIFF